VKSRSSAARAIEEHKVTVNGAPAKASREIKEGDVIELSGRTVVKKIRVIRVPERQLPKAEARDYYEVMEERKLLDDRW